MPRRPGVLRLVHPVSHVECASHLVAGADVDDVQIRRRHLHRADRRDFLDRIEHRIPGLAGAGSLPYAASREARVECPDVANHAGDG